MASPCRRLPGIAPALAAAVLCLLGAFTAAPRAHAATGIRYGLTDDAWLQDSPGPIDARVAHLKAIGVRVVRYTLHWNEIAPTKPVDATDPSDPAYDWTDASTVLDSLRTHGIDVVVQLLGAPRWANGGKAANYAPTSSSTFGAFAAAAAQQYSWVRKWVIWNEPNQVIWLRPTNPRAYVTRLLNPAYTAIHREIPAAKVAGGGTAPRGASGGVSPVAWLEAMHAAHAKLDAYAHNPYPLDPKHETPVSGGCGHCTTISMADLRRLEALVAKDFPKARIWLTEYGYQTNPPDRLLGVSPALQATYQAEADYVAYAAPRVDLLIHFLYQDEPNVTRFQSGLTTLGGKAKPALGGFELPLAETGRGGATASLWGQLRAPAAGHSATLERKVGSTWRRIATVHGGSAGFFRWHGALARGTVVRLVSGSLSGAALLVT
ncbi:MAG TPA: hypothetical protein VHC67_10455 [Gaiellaceae bacterium]|jgi:hypothetical protein|nr:hypothetical protein [Gaiellaceae bacterium]